MLNLADMTITSTLSADIALDLGSLMIISWLGSAYLIATAVVQPLSGKLTDIFGRRAGLYFCCFFFALGNAMCGIAHSKSVMVLGRMAAGLGGGGLNTISAIVGNDLIPLRTRGLIQGFGMVTYSAGIGLGGVVGGAIGDVWGWRWAFLVLIPLTFVTAFGVWLFIPGPTKNGDRPILKRIGRVDFLGSFSLSAAIALLLWCLNSDSYSNNIKPQLQLGVALPISISLFSLFILVEARWASEPIIPLNLMRNRTVAAAAFASFFHMMTMYTLMFYVPLYLQVKGFSPRKVGIRLLPEPLGAALGSLISGAIMRATGGYGITKFFFLGIFTAGAAGYSSSDLNTADWKPEVFLFINGFGFGGSLTVLLLALLSAVRHEMQAVATSLMYTFRSVGATLGVTVAGILFRQVLLDHVGQASEENKDPVILWEMLRKCRLQGEAEGACPQWLLSAYMCAVHSVFLLALGFSISCLICGSLTQNLKLRNTLEDENGS